MEELIKKIEMANWGKFTVNGDGIIVTNKGLTYDDRDEIIKYLKQLQKIKEYLELSLKDSDQNQRKYNEIAEHTHNSNDVYSAKIFEGMSEAYADLLEKFFKEKEL